MITNPPKHEAPKVDEYIAEGYTASYQMEDGKLKDLETGKTFEPCDVTIYDEYRYEGMSNPSDMSILYALQTADGGKGTLLIPYGPSADGEIAWFMKEVTLDMEKRSMKEINNQLNNNNDEQG